MADAGLRVLDLEQPKGLSFVEMDDVARLVLPLHAHEPGADLAAGICQVAEFRRLGEGRGIR